MKVLITGGTGFIGSHLAQRCVNQGHHVRILAQENTTAERANAQSVQNMGCEVVNGSVADEAMVRHACQSIDVIYHLAAAQHEAGASDQHFRDVNVVGTKTMLDAALEAGVQRFVHGSTIGVYQANHAVVNDESPTIPDNIYGVTKLQAEQVVNSYRDRLSVVTIRISETYGPGDRRLLKLFKAIQSRRFYHIGAECNLHHPVYVTDLITALEQAGTFDAGGIPSIPMVAPGYEAVTTRQMVEQIADALSVPAPTRAIPLTPIWMMATMMELTMRPLGITPPLHRRRMHFFTKSFNFTGELAKKTLRYEPSVSFAEGAQRTAAWYKAEGLLN